MDKKHNPRKRLEKISYILLGIAGIMALGFLVYIVKVPPGEGKHPILLLTSVTIGLALNFISFVLRDLSEGKKTVKEAIATTAVEMVMLALFILIANLLRK